MQSNAADAGSEPSGRKDAASPIKHELASSRKRPADCRNGESFAAKAGDAILHPPGEAHQIRNNGTGELIDLCVYPNSGKAHVLVPGGQKLIRYSAAEDLDYFDGEE